MNWNELLERDDIVGGDLETREESGIYRARISKVEMEGECIKFTFLWATKRVQSMWVKHDYYDHCSVNTKIVQHPEDLGGGKVHFNMPFQGYATIFPKGMNNLKPTDVIGWNAVPLDD